MLVQLRDQAGIGFIKLQKRLAPSDLLRGDGLAREIHSPASRYVAGRRRRGGGQACLLACLRNIFSTICSNLYLFLFTFCARLRCDLFTGGSFSHGLMRLHSGGVPKVSQNTRYRSRSTQRHPSLTRRNRTRAAPSER